jgi:GT2 family glycosyltransferase
VNHVIVVARNNLALTKKAVASALLQDVPCTVLVVDNASTDGTADWLRGKDGIHYWVENKQQSLARCWNVALKCVWAMGGKHALVINNDVELRSDCYRVLRDHGSLFVTAFPVDTKAEMGVPGDCDEKDLHDRPYPVFSCWLIRKEVTDRGCWFREELYPAYTEDNFFHLAMHHAGIKAICIDLPFLHHGEATLKHCDPAEKSMILRGAQKNREKFKREFGCYPASPEYSALFR